MSVDCVYLPKHIKLGMDYCQENRQNSTVLLVNCSAKRTGKRYLSRTSDLKKLKYGECDIVEIKRGVDYEKP